MTLFKDTPGNVIFLGGVVPGLILCLVAVNLATGCVWWPSRSGIEVYTDLWRVAGTVGFKTGIAAAFVSWHLLANLKRAGRYAELCLAGSIVVAAVGLVLCVIGFFV
ncbi:MAG TPA: hypothetical protein VMZ92_09105 [Planctomycetota bacterium]|nr:hypothetical protein [Planctomycetota bacterium]